MIRVRNWILAGVFGVSACAMGAGLPGPKTKSPTYPLEPEKKPSAPVQPSTYVPGAQEPPPVAQGESIIPRIKTASGEDWDSSLRLGWIFLNQTADHSLVSGANSYGVKREIGTPQAIQARLVMRPPRLPISLNGSVMAGFGTAKVSAPQALLPQIDATHYKSDYTFQEIQLSAGARAYLGERAALHELGGGLDLGGSFSNTMTLNSSRTLVDVDSRKLITVTPRVEYRYQPRENWAAEASVGQSFSILTGGSNDVRGDTFGKTLIDLDLVRYLSERTSLSFGASWQHETVTWTQTLPSALQDTNETTELRVGVSWRREL